MDRSADDIGTIISGMQRDMEELKSTQLTSDNIADGSVTSSKIANGAVTKEKIDWPTMKTTFTATTDGSGFMEVPTDVVTPYNGFILGARKHEKTGSSADDAMYIPFSNYGSDRYTLKVMLYNLNTINNTSIEVDIIYCLA